MDLETENRIATILLREAAEMRRQAQKEGALAYLREPTVRSRPNSRFLTATVRGVQQANRAVEINEMWRIREKQLELDNKLEGTQKESNNRRRGYKDVCESRATTSRARNEVDYSASGSLSSKKRSIEDHDPMEDEGLKDDEIDQFLQSRAKRGRGAVGSRMDETGPYPPLDMKNILDSDNEMSNRPRVVLGPEKPHWYKYSESEPHSHKKKKEKKKMKSKADSSKRHTKKHKSKDKRDDKKHKS